MRQAIAYRPMLALAIALAAALAWHVAPWSVLACLPFFAFGRTVPFALVGLSLGLWLAPRPAEGIQDREAVLGELDVVSVPRLQSGSLLFDGVAEGRRWSVTMPGHPDVSLGDCLQITGIGRPLPEASARYASLQGIQGRVTVVRWSTLERGSPLARLSDAWRRSFARFCERYMRPEVAALTEALAVNLDGTLDDATREDLRATGTVHIVSASGLHVYVLAAALTWALSQMPIPRWLQLVALALLLAFYALATGLNAPVMRSIAMALIGLSAYFFRRDGDPLSSLALAAALYLLFRPRGVFDIGFQLSFLTVGGLAAFGPQGRDYPEGLIPYLLHLTKDGVHLSWIAFLSSAPLIAYYFGTVSLIALPANFLIAAAVPFVVVASLLAHLVSGFWLALSVGLIKLVEAVVGYILVVIHGLGGLEWAQVALPAIPVGVLVVVYAALALTWRQRIVHP